MQTWNERDGAPYTFRLMIKNNVTKNCTSCSRNNVEKYFLGKLHQIILLLLLGGAKITQSILIGEIVLHTNQVFSVTEISQISFIFDNAEQKARYYKKNFKKIFRVLKDISDD